MFCIFSTAFWRRYGTWNMYFSALVDCKLWLIKAKPTAVGAYALRVTPLIHFLTEFIFITEHRSKEVAFVDDFTVAGKASKIKAYWDILTQQEPLFDYFPKSSKSYLIVKEQHYNKAVDVFMGSNIRSESNTRRKLTPWCCNW